VLNLARITIVGEALSKLLDDLALGFDFLQQEHTAIRCDRASIKLGHHLPRSAGLKLQLFISTLCLHFLAPSWWNKHSVPNALSHGKDLSCSN
jgi:hypothetical protein